MSLSLTACGGGSGGSSGSSAGGASNNAGGDNSQPAAEQSFVAMTKALINADENSEPMDILEVTLNSDADDDETAFVELMPLEN